MKLKEIRMKKGLLQKNIADILELNQATVSRIEAGERNLNQAQIIKLCLRLDVTPDELLGFKEAYKKYTEYLLTLGNEKPKH